MELRGSLRHCWKKEDGATMVEFSLLLTVLLLIILGTIQFGLMWYTKYVITAASREGARYASIYRTTSTGDRLAPVNYSPSVQQVVQNYVNRLLTEAEYTVEVVNNTAYQTGTAGEDLIVRVHCQNPWDLLGGLVPGMKDITFHSETVMKCE